MLAASPDPLAVPENGVVMPPQRSSRAWMRPWPARCLAVPLVVVTATLLTACGTSGSHSNASAQEHAAERNAEGKFVDFAKCLREHGANVEVRPGGQGLKFRGGSEGFAAAQAADTACARYRPEPHKVNISAQQKIEQEEIQRKFAKCMRTHGVHLPQAKVLNTGGGNQEAYLPGVDPQSPGFLAAVKVCGGPKG
jgi:hypothetical protein